MSLSVVVVDASSLVDLVLGDDNAAPLQRIFRSQEATIWVPALCDLEVATVVRRELAIGRIGEKRARAALDDYLDLSLRRFGHHALLPRVLELRANFTVYDAVYVALAERLGGKLLTADRRLARAVASHTRVALQS